MSHRLCVVLNCDKNYQGPKNQRTLFKFPSDLIECYKWLDAVGDRARKARISRKNMYICSLHFEANCLFGEPTKVLKNGIWELIPRQRVRLKDNSLPSIFNVSQENLKQKKSTDRDDVRPTISLVDSSEHQEPHVTGKGDRNPDIVAMPNTSNMTHPKSQLMQINKKLKQNKSTEPDGVRPTISLMDSSEHQEPHVIGKGDRNPDIVAMPNTSNMTHPKSQLMQVDSQPVDQRNNTPKSMSCTENYSRDNLIDDWKTNSTNELFQQWGISVTNNGVLFFCFGDLTEEQSNEIAASLFVKNDMTVEVKFRGRPVKFPIVSVVRSFQDLSFAITKMSCLRVCASISCQDSFYIPLPKSGSYYCKPCRKKNKLQRDRERSEKRREKRKQKRSLEKVQPAVRIWLEDPLNFV